VALVAGCRAPRIGVLTAAPLPALAWIQILDKTGTLTDGFGRRSPLSRLMPIYPMMTALFRCSSRSGVENTWIAQRLLLRQPAKYSWFRKNVVEIPGEGVAGFTMAGWWLSGCWICRSQMGASQISTAV
jgi:hypothetical protein